MNKLIGKIAIITDKESLYFDEWGIIKHFDGDYYHISIANGNNANVFSRNEFKVKRKKS